MIEQGKFTLLLSLMYFFRRNGCTMSFFAFMSFFLSWQEMVGLMSRLSRSSWLNSSTDSSRGNRSRLSMSIETACSCTFSLDRDVLSQLSREEAGKSMVIKDKIKRNCHRIWYPCYSFPYYLLYDCFSYLECDDQNLKQQQPLFDPMFSFEAGLV